MGFEGRETLRIAQIAHVHGRLAIFVGTAERSLAWAGRAEHAQARGRDFVAECHAH